MDLRALGVLVGAILSTVRRAFFVRCRSASGTSQGDYDFEPPEFFHGSWYLGLIVPRESLLRCSIQIGEFLHVACVFRSQMVRCWQWGVLGLFSGSPGIDPGYRIHHGFGPRPVWASSSAGIPQHACPWLAQPPRAYS
jgi:hypothetical protein